MERKNKIAVSVDFTDTSRHSFSESLYLARRGNFEVVIVHVNSDPTKTEADFDTLISEMIQEQGSEADGIAISYRIVPGDRSEIVERLARAVDQIDPVYLVVGYEVKHGLDRFVGPNIKKIISETKYPVIAIKNMETLKELKTLVFPLTLDPHSRQKTNISMKFVEDMGLELCLLSMRINNTSKDNVHQDIITKNLQKKFDDHKLNYRTSWEEGADEIALILSKMEENHSQILSVVFESSPDFIDNFRSTREELLLEKTEDPLLIVKSHYSPFY